MSLAVRLISFQARQLKFHVSPYPSSNPFKESNVKVDAESGDRRQKVRYPTSVGSRQKTTTRLGREMENRSSWEVTLGGSQTYAHKASLSYFVS